jgi:hypothetical protein
VDNFKNNTLSHIPSLKLLLLKAATKRNRFHSSDITLNVLPKLEYKVNNIQLLKQNMVQYQRVVGWPDDSSNVHPCYLHTLAFPLHIKLMLSKQFTYPLLGLVHISNQIKQYRLVAPDECLRLVCRFKDLQQHPKGWSFFIECEFLNRGNLVWMSRSQYLYRVKHNKLPNLIEVKTDLTEQGDLSEPHKLDSDLGRQYAKVSGDYNPIHLYKLSAKFFGFKRHIIHGMWTKAFSLSALQKNGEIDLAQSFQVDTDFKLPLYLPNTIHFLNLEFLPDKQDFTMLSKSKHEDKLHLSGTLKLI